MEAGSPVWHQSCENFFKVGRYSFIGELDRVNLHKLADMMSWPYGDHLQVAVIVCWILLVLVPAASLDNWKTTVTVVEAYVVIFDNSDHHFPIVSHIIFSSFIYVYWAVICLWEGKTGSPSSENSKPFQGLLYIWQKKRKVGSSCRYSAICWTLLWESILHNKAGQSMLKFSGTIILGENCQFHFFCRLHSSHLLLQQTGWKCFRLGYTEVIFLYFAKLV